MKKITELSNELNISRNKIYRLITKLSDEDKEKYICLNNDGVQVITEQGEQFIKQALYHVETEVNKERTDKEQVVEVDNSLIKYLEQQLLEKDRMLHHFQEENKQLLKLLDQQQQLTLQQHKSLDNHDDEYKEKEDKKGFFYRLFNI